jgi:hypothetical protein
VEVRRGRSSTGFKSRGNRGTPATSRAGTNGVSPRFAALPAEPHALEGSPPIRAWTCPPCPSVASTRSTGLSHSMNSFGSVSGYGHSFRQAAH